MVSLLSRLMGGRGTEGEAATELGQRQPPAKVVRVLFTFFCRDSILLPSALCTFDALVIWPLRLRRVRAQNWRAPSSPSHEPVTALALLTTHPQYNFFSLDEGLLYSDQWPTQQGRTQSNNSL